VKLIRTLMCRDLELLEFEADSETGAVSSIRVLDESCNLAGHKTPSFVGWGGVKGSLIDDVERVLHRRCISPRRADLPEILLATGARSAAELTLRSNGCSLSDQYWYRPRGSQLRWEDVNFYDNDWDPSFGEAVLSRNWGALAKASVETPDITCNGWTRKSWIVEDGRKRLLKSSPIGGVTYLYGEIVVTHMLSRFLKPSEFTPYEMVHRYGEDYVACDNMLGSAEEHISTDCLLGLERARFGDGVAGASSEVLNVFVRELQGIGVDSAPQIAAKIAVVSALSLCRDRHFFNYGIIRNVETGSYRASPLYDYGGSFGLGAPLESLRALCENPKFLALVVTSLFRELDSSWDYAWYDPRALEGFDEELEDELSAIDGLPATYPKIVRNAFSMQLKYVNEVACDWAVHHA